MRRLLVLGAGTAGPLVVNKLRHRLGKGEWQISVVDQSDRHFYQPGYLFVPFGGYLPEEIAKPRQRFIPEGVDLVRGEVERVAPDGNVVLLADGRRLPTTTCSSPRLWSRGRTKLPACSTAGSGARASSTSTPLMARWPRPRRSRASTAARLWRTSWTCRSSAQSRRWRSRSSSTLRSSWRARQSSRSSPHGGCRSGCPVR